jgi:hypothetical protein
MRSTLRLLDDLPLHRDATGTYFNKFLEFPTGKNDCSASASRSSGVATAGAVSAFQIDLELLA